MSRITRVESPSLHVPIGRPLQNETQRMTFKADKWIRRMAESHKMIEPFESGPVREVDGRRIVESDEVCRVSRRDPAAHLRMAPHRCGA